MTRITSARAKDHYALLCECGVGKDKYMICGVLASREEAGELYKACEGCAAKHTIKKVSISVKWL